MTFFGILFILIAANAVFMFFSLNRASEKTVNRSQDTSQSKESDIYPIDLLPSKYKKAV